MHTTENLKLHIINKVKKEMVHLAQYRKLNQYIEKNKNRRVKRYLDELNQDE